jgi:hypothetical protein
MTKEHTSIVAMFINRDSGVRTCRLISANQSMFRSVRPIESNTEQATCSRERWDWRNRQEVLVLSSYLCDITVAVKEELARAGAGLEALADPRGSRIIMTS